MGAEGQKWLQGVWLPFGEESATTPAQNDTRLELLKNNQSSSAAGSTGLAFQYWPAHSLVPGLCLSLEQVLGLMAKHQGGSSETSLLSTELGGLRRSSGRAVIAWF